MKAYKAYDPKNDYAGACLPYGWPRAIQGLHPLQLVQSDDFMAFLFEQNSWFTVVPIDGRPHPKDANDFPTWFGNTVGRWEGDTLVLDTVALVRLSLRDHVCCAQLLHRFSEFGIGGSGRWQFGTA